MTVLADQPLLNLTCGGTFAPEFEFFDASDMPISVVDCVARMEIRRCVDDDEVILALDSDTARGGIGGITLLGNSVAIYINSSETEALRDITYHKEKLVYDLKLYSDPNTCSVVLSGRVRVTHSVTQEP